MTREEIKIQNWNLNHKKIDNKVYRYCKICNTWKVENTENFYMLNKNIPEKGFQSECKECAVKRSKINRDNNHERQKANQRAWKQRVRDSEIIKSREWRINNLEHKQEYERQYRENNKDKIKKYSELHHNHDITKSEEQSLLHVFNYECAYCGMSLKEHKKKYGSKLHNDHVDCNGYNDLRNDVPACTHCNCSKWIYTLDEWYPKQEFFNQERLDKINWWIAEGYKEYIEQNPSYIIKRIRHENNSGYDFNLWSIDEKRELKEIMFTASTKKEILNYIKEHNIE